MKNILCYGDSNTWGFVPGTLNFKTSYVERYPRDIRWTGLLQQYLGNNYYIIEEGLNGRTTDVDTAGFPGRNGKTYLVPCLYSHAPLDLVILFLGTNDLKAEFNRSAMDIAMGLGALVNIIKESIYGFDMQSPPKVLIIGGPLIVHENFLGANGEKIFAGAVEKGKQLPKVYQQLAEQQQCYYYDVSSYVEFSKIDGVHMDERAHKKFAELIVNQVRNIL